MFMYSSTAKNFIPALWSDHSSPTGSRTSSPRHHNNTRHQNATRVNTFNLRPIPTSAPSISKQKHLKIALFNTRSLNNISLILNEFIIDQQLDLLCLNETWQKPLDYFSLNQTTSARFSYLDNPRSEIRGGGIAAIYQQDLQPRPLTIPAAPSFEHLAFKFFFLSLCPLLRPGA